MKKNYVQHARTAWLSHPLFKDWVVIENHKADHVRCKYCYTFLMAKSSVLKLHLKSEKHQQNSKFLNVVNKTKQIEKMLSTKDEAKIAEARFALYVAKHSSISSVDHLILVNKSAINDSKICQELNLARTKCGALIKNVWFPFLQEKLKSEVGSEHYSLIIDESTDISITKFLGVIIKYYSVETKRIDVAFLKLITLENCDANGIVEGIKHVLKEYKLSINKMKGLGTDNASVMVGVNNGVHKKLSDINPHIILITCVCHSLQLCASHATEEHLPPKIEFLVSETYNWFCRSYTRQSAYNVLYQLINDGHNPHKLVQTAKTRWMSIFSAIDRVIQQWLELKTHFELVRKSCYIAEQLFQLYSDESNLCYLKYLKTILWEVQRVNKIFESRDNIDPFKLFDELIYLLKAICKNVCVMRPSFDVFESPIEENLLPNPYLGFEFEDQMAIMKTQEKISLTEEKELRKKCLLFTTCLIKEIRNRLPKNIKILQKISIFSIQNTLNPCKNDAEKTLLSVLHDFNVDKSLIPKIESQWKSIHLQKWQNNTSSTEFWCEVRAYKDIIGQNPFEDLADFVISLLILPISNAEVERLFSLMNNIKTKKRNALQVEMLNSILMVQDCMRRENCCCYNKEIPKEIVKKIGTMESYKLNSDLTDQIDFNELF